MCATLRGVKFEVWTNAAPPVKTRRVVSTNSWALANFYARLVSLGTGAASIIADQAFDGDKPGDKTMVATYAWGRAERFFAGAPGVPSIWP